MRKDAKNRTIDTSLTRIAGYHEGSYGVNYAYQGFRANKYFTSDRFIKLNERFERPDGKPLQGFGLEIETECNGIRNSTVLAEVMEKIVFAAFPADLFKMQRDGSLGGDTSVECITQVMTRDFIRNNYPAFKAMYDTYFPAFGIGCDSGNCGMHVNISNACFGNKPESQELAIKKLLYIVNKHFGLFCALTNRDRRCTHYCSRMTGYADVENVKRANLDRVNGGHGVCFNLDHYREGRVELRIVGGQKSYACFRNTMESVFHVIAAVKKLSWADCDDVTKIFAGCNQYVFDRLRSKVRNAGAISDSQLMAIADTVKREELI